MTKEEQMEILKFIETKDYLLKAIETCDSAKIVFEEKILETGNKIQIQIMITRNEHEFISHMELKRLKR